MPQGKPLSTAKARAAWLWARRDRWGSLPGIDAAAARTLFKEMQAAGLYSRKTAAIDGWPSVQAMCELARQLHRKGELA
jgi:hypothetical protein